MKEAQGKHQGSFHSNVTLKQEQNLDQEPGLPSEKKGATTRPQNLQPRTASQAKHHLQDARSCGAGTSGNRVPGSGAGGETAVAADAAEPRREKCFSRRTSDHAKHNY